MRCEFCGHINEPGALFCARCGAQIAAGQTPQQPPPEVAQTGQYAAPSPQGWQQPPPEVTQTGQYETPQSNYAQNRRVSGGKSKLKSLPLKKILMIAIPVVVIIIAVIIILPMLSNSGGTALKNNISFFTDKGIVVVSGDNNPKFTIDGEIEDYQKSMDGSKAAVLIDYKNNTGGELWFVTTSACYRIADDVLEFELSDSGSGIAYLTDYDSRNDVATLYLYDTASKKATKVTEDAFYDGYSGMMGICISPNGRSVSYITDYDERNEEFTGYIQIDGKSPEKLGKNTFAIAVSDGGRHLYYAKLSDNGYSASFHVRSGRNDVRLVSDASTGQSIMFNKDYSEVLYTVEDRTYIYRTGNSERERVGNQPITRLVVPRGTQTGGTSGLASITVYGLRNFNSFVALTNEGLVHINSKLESNRISSSSDYGRYAVISSDGKTLLFINNNGHLSAIDPTKPGAERREVAKNVTSYVATSDAKTIYYINDDDELYCVKGNGAPTKISDDASRMVLSYNGSRLFFLVDYRSNRGGELYTSNNGGRRMGIPGADETMSLWVTPANVFYINRDDEVFRSNGNDNFSLFEQDVSRY